MTMHHFSKRSRLPVSAAAAYAWHSRPGALTRLMPPWEDARVVRSQGGIDDEGEVEVAMRVGPFRTRWIARHLPSIPGHEFRDIQARGPFAYFDHQHRFIPDGPDGCFLEDEIEYRLPAGAVGELLIRRLVERKLQATFAYRHRITAADLQAHARYADRPPMRVLISGATGLIGSGLQAFLTTGGHQVQRLNRQKRTDDSPNDVVWNPHTGEVSDGALHGFDAVIHLAGESIASGRWTAARKKSILDSRAIPTRLLCEKLAASPTRPRVLVCASAIGFYGDRGDEELTESSPPGEGFLPHVCREWEHATSTAAAAGIRVVNVRLGIVLSPRGGALKQMLLPMKCGAGGKIGSGQQYWSWVAYDDVLGAIYHSLQEEKVAGPVNVVAPLAPTNSEFTRALGKTLHRPTIAPLPALVARLMLGEMADALLLASARVKPERLTQTGYEFREPELGAALQHLLGR